MVARRDWTREWWDDHLIDYDVFTSEAVIEELEAGSFPIKNDALALIQSLPLLEADEAIADIVATYIFHHVMPEDPTQLLRHWNFLGRYNCHER
ncbi:MAG: hypothetical protein KAV82_03440 [Phycisphaerae bacterium]|nr:hypothetical protein [Phycisphaerae bacterium]